MRNILRALGARLPKNIASVAIGAALAFSAADAAASGYFVKSYSIAEIYDSNTGTSIQPWGPHYIEAGNNIQTSTFNTSASTVYSGGTFNGKSASSSSSGDLATGTLSAIGTVSNTTSTPNQNVNAYGMITFGDSFSITSPTGPFVWDSSDLVTFNMTLTGALQQTNESTFPWYVQLYIYEPGAIGPDFVFDDMLFRAASWSENRSATGVSTIYQDQFDYGLGNSSMVFSLSNSGSLETGGVTLSASFNPGGDFDWAIYFQAGASLSTGIGTESSDLSHTLTVGYEGPEGSVTHSGSGVFPSTVSAVPVPAAAWLFSSGLLGLVGAARKRHKVR